METDAPGPGRPPHDLGGDIEGITGRLAAMGFSLDMTARILGTSPATLRRRLRSWGHPDFASVLKKGAGMRADLRALQWRAAQRGNAAMLIHLGKIVLGQREPRRVVEVRAVDQMALLHAGAVLGILGDRHGAAEPAPAPTRGRAMHDPGPAPLPDEMPPAPDPAPAPPPGTGRAWARKGQTP